MKSNPVYHIAIVASVLSEGFFFASTSVLAAESKVHQFGATEVTAMLSTSLGYGDNVFRGSDVQTSSGIFRLQPSVQAIRESNKQTITLGYEGSATAFSNSSDDNHSSNTISGDYIRRLNSVSEFGVGFGFEDGSSIRGSGVTEGSNGNVDGATEFTRKDMSLSYAIGSEKVGPSLALAYNLTDLKFDNFELINQGRDYQLKAVTARLGYQYSVVTDFFVDLGHSDFSYDGTSSFLGANLNSTEQSLLVGVGWRFNRLTSGEISVGTVDKDFDNFSDPSSFTAWNAQLEWTPTARDTITLESLSKPFEQVGTGLFQEVTQTTIDWNRNISKKLSVSAGMTIGAIDFGSVSREDDFDTVNLGVVYRSGRYSEWALNYEYEEKESTLAEFNYDSNNVFLTYSLSL